MQSQQTPPGNSSAQPRRSIWRSPYTWAVLAGLILIPAMRPFLRYEPPPPKPLFELPPYTLVDTTGAPFGSGDLEGQVYIANFIFTRCPSICPLLTRAMSQLAKRFDEEGVDGVRLVSFSVDPTNDTPEVLRDYAERHGADPKRWTFLTGDLEAMHQLLVGGFRVGMGDPEARGDGDLFDIAHSAKLVLVDQAGRVRGFYDTDDLGLDEVFHRAQHVLHRG